jgi:hypothetical protein
VSLRRPRRDAEPTTDFLVRATLSDQLDHLTLTIRDDRRPLMKQFDHAGEATNGPARCLLTQGRIFAATPKGVAGR